MADREGAKNNGSTVTVGDFIFEGYKKKKYVCQVCGFELEAEGLPEGYKCPICGVGADKFVEANN